ncbi:MAG: ATP synthase F1 subunit delta [Methylocella sp.]
MKAGERAIAFRYARALFRYAVKNHRVEETREFIETFERAFTANRDVVKLLEHPRIPTPEKYSLIDRMAEGASPWLAEFVKLLIRRGRIGLFSVIAAIFEELWEDHIGVVRGQLVVARPLTPDQRVAIADKLKAKLHKEVLLEEKLDPGALGGAAVVLGGKIFDDTIRFHLDTLKRKLLAEETWPRAIGFAPDSSP